MKILIVEDNKSQSASLECLLESYGCECRIAEYGSEAIRLVNEYELWAFDCAIIDMSLRDEADGTENKDTSGGIKVAREMQKRNLPFIILSDHCPPQSPNFDKLTKEFKVDGSAVYTKPTRPRILYEHLLTLVKS